MRQIKTGIERKAVEIEVVPSVEFIGDVLPHKRVHYMSRSGVAQPVQKLPEYLAKRLKETGQENNLANQRKMLRQINKGENATSRFVLALHTAFAKHIPFSLSPEVIMGIISQEVAQFVKDHSDNPSVASLFTKNPEEKEKIVVEVHDFLYGSPNNNWLYGISKFRNLLVERVPSEILDCMTPRFSQNTLEIEVAHLVSFMDAASEYYEYGMVTMCGIPEFRIEGTADDWNLILKSVEKLNEQLPGLEIYFKHLKPILTEIINTVDGNKVDLDFWCSIYKENHQSGGPFSNGWFNNLYAHVYNSLNWKNKKTSNILKTEAYFAGTPQYKLNCYPANLSIVPFDWNYVGQLIPMNFVAGVTSVEYEEGFLTPRLGVAVIE